MSSSRSSAARSAISKGLPFLEAIRQIPLEIGKQNCLFIHLTLVPYLKAAKEAKTKPTQHSVGSAPRRSGSSRTSSSSGPSGALGKKACEKIALFCNVEQQAVIEEQDKELSIYEVPLSVWRRTSWTGWSSTSSVCRSAS